ncbi:MAG: hypothetical protein ABIJ10_05765, partial [Candidatus Micrarchaeota archaeon]|nr:hypothetical protein [Candidatus Micrarchaeota archaeon]MBU1886449.1 hypothetical protein [Candidatus Micrarchaeota archaeon]
MMKNLLLVLFGILLLATNLAFAESIIFMHHSVGADLIQYGGLRGGLNESGHSFYDHDYNWIGLTLADGSSAGMNFDVPGDNTDPDGYAAIFAQPAHSSPDNTFSYMLQYDIIIFKSCFYASRILSDAQLDNYHTYYLSIRDVADTHPEKLFIIVTSPPNSPTDSDTGGAPAANRARAFANWLKSDEYLAGHPNIVVFDLFDQLADGSNFLRAAYRSSDSHPNVLADETVGPIFVSFIDTAIDNFDAGTPTPTCSDSDGGRSYSLLGTTSNSTGTSGTDSCLADGRLREFYCSGTSVISETVSCSTGYECSTGRCIESEPEPLCSDSDAGRTYTTQGTTSNSTGTNQSDFCLADGRLTEYYCSNTSVVSETVSCSADYECSVGRCAESTPEPEPSESSVFIDFETTEYSWDRWDGSAATMSCSRTTSAHHNGSWSLDLNYNVRAGQEATCGTSFEGLRNLSNGTGLSFWYTSDVVGLPLKATMFSGNPSDPTPFEVTFVSSAESTTGWVHVSFLWSEFEKVPWAWQPETEVNTVRVTGISFGVSSVSSGTWRVDDVGLSGTAPEPEPLVCNDPDGRNYTTRSTANDSLGTTGTDSCLADGRLQEYYCSANNTIVSELVACTAGFECSLGTCVEIPTNASTDLLELHNVILTSTSGSNYSSEDLTLSWNLSGADEDRVKVVTSWYVNDQIINILNLPFEAGSNSETTFDFAS